MEEGRSYLLKNVVVNEWNGKAQVQLNRSSSIEELDEDIEEGPPCLPISGQWWIYRPVPLIKRCPECKGSC